MHKNVADRMQHEEAVSESVWCASFSLGFKGKPVLRPVPPVAYSPNGCDFYATTDYIPPNSVTDSFTLDIL